MVNIPSEANAETYGRILRATIQRLTCLGHKALEPKPSLGGNRLAYELQLAIWDTNSTIRCQVLKRLNEADFKVGETVELLIRRPEH